MAPKTETSIAADEILMYIFLSNSQIDISCLFVVGVLPTLKIGTILAIGRVHIPIVELLAFKCKAKVNW